MKKVDNEFEEAVFQALSANERREILKIITREQAVSYTEILGELNMTTGNLNYHLKQLEGFIEKDENGRYIITPLGKTAINVLAATYDTSNGVNTYVDLARLSQSRGIHPTVTRLLWVGIIFNLLILSIYGYMAYVLIVEGGAIFVKFVLVVLIIIFIYLLSLLIRGLRSTPTYIKRLEKKLELIS